MIPKMERDFVAADLAAVEALLQQMTEEDALTAMSLEARRDELRAILATLQPSAPVTNASAALFFSGRPVAGALGIESEFGAAAVDKFQDVVAKVFALQQTGSLGQRGAIPGKEHAILHITNVVHGSFGFRLEELAVPRDAVGAPLQEALDQTSVLMDVFGEPDDEQFVKAIADLDERVLIAIRNFFGLMRDNEATFRLVSGSFDRSFNQQSVTRATERARLTTLHEETAVFAGQLAGALRDSRIFEYRTQTERGTIQGKVVETLSSDAISEMNQHWADKDSTATVHVKQVLRSGHVYREVYTLINVEPRSSSRSSDSL